MAQDTKIEWAKHTVNLWWGCSKVHEGCDHCYAEALSKRYGDNVWGGQPRKLIKSAFDNLLKYQDLAKKAGEKHFVFLGSMMDVFEKPMPLIDGKGLSLNYSTEGLRQKLFMNVGAGLYSNLIFLFLTKRPSNINKYIPTHWQFEPPKNVMFGTSVSTQKNADTLIPQLLKVKGKKFLSVEPQIESINLSKYLPHIDWVIQGGESGAGKRPFNLAWAYDLKDQCAVAGAPYFFKQIDKVQPVPNDLLTRQIPLL